MDKISEKVTKDPKRQEQGKKSHETYMKRLKEKILEDNQLPTPSHTNSLRLPPLLLHLLPLPLRVILRLLPLPTTQGQMILTPIALLYLLSLPLVFVYFSLFRLKIKKLSIKNRIRCHNDFMSLRNLYNKWVALIGRKTLKTLSKTD